MGRLINDPRPFQNLQLLIDSLTQRLTGGGGETSAFPQLKNTPAPPERKQP